MPAPASYPDTWGSGPRIDLDEEMADHQDGRHDTDPRPGICPGC